MGFFFVDRITAIDADTAVGELWQAPEEPPLPPWLVIEAVGQLAAWVAMWRTDFASRPVAALVGEVVFGGVRGGSITLDARLERIDGRAVLYSGRARADGKDIVVLRRCVGPLLPTDDFDDRGAVRERFAALCAASAGGAAAVARTLPQPEIAELALDARSGRARLYVPACAPYFADHFPRRPVFPATMLAPAQNQLGGRLAAQILAEAPAAVRLVRVTNFKVRSFSPPGQVLDLGAQAEEPDGDGITIVMTASAEGVRVASGVFEYRRAGAA